MTPDSDLVSVLGPAKLAAIHASRPICVVVQARKPRPSGREGKKKGKIGANIRDNLLIALPLSDPTPVKATFIEPMLLERASTLPDGSEWLHELKLDGYRAIAFRSGGRVHLRSRNDKDFTERYIPISKALGALPDDTVIDGEIVALDENGRPSFSALQNYGSSKAPIFYYAFDVMLLKGRNVMAEPLDVRRELLESEVLPKLAEPIRCSPLLPGTVADLVRSVKVQGLEGLVAKRRDSRYEAGLRSGTWLKMRVNRGRSS